MTRLLSVILVTALATSAFSEIISEEKPRDVLEPAPHVHPKDTLRYYLNNLTNYIYDTDLSADVDARAAFFNQEHQLRIYETLNEYVEKNYGATLREILSDEYLLSNDHRVEDEAKEELKKYYIGLIIELENRISEMFLKVIYTSGDKPIEQERLQEVQEKRRSLVNSYAKFATWEQLVNVYDRLEEVHLPVLNNFNNTVWHSRRVKRALLDDNQLKNQLNDYLRKFTAYAYGISEFEFLSAKIDLVIQPPGSLISLKRFIEANYREFLKKEVEIRFVDKYEKIEEIEEIKQIEERTTALWFEVVNKANLDLLANQTIIDDINAAIAERLDEYMQFRTLEELKETNRRIYEVYGHPSKSCKMIYRNCDESAYATLDKMVKGLNLTELYPNPNGTFRLSFHGEVQKAFDYAEAQFQPKHGMSKNERGRVYKLLHTVNEQGIIALKGLLVQLLEMNGNVIEPQKQFHLNVSEETRPLFYYETKNSNVAVKLHPDRQ